MPDMIKLCSILLLLSVTVHAQKGISVHTNASTTDLYRDFKQPPAAAAPWVFWYWMQASVSREGITADLEAMKAAGIGGAYLMSIKGATNPPLMEPVMEQLSSAWWEMVMFAMKEAERTGVKLAMHVSDGFALAGGPWITPELSMQKVVYSATTIKGGRLFSDTLTQPESYKGYYRDIAVFAYPSKEALPGETEKPVITTSLSTEDISYLADKNNTKTIGSNDSCWIQYAYKKPFTCRSIVIRTNGNNYQAHRLLLQVSDDGVHFRNVERMHPPRRGWQDTDADVTHSIVAVTAKYFRFIYDKKGSEPGSEDLDAAKWKPSFKIKGIELLSAPRINQYEGKTGEVWRISAPSTKVQIPDAWCIPQNKIIPLTSRMVNGKLVWKVPAGRWTILRMGHTSTGHTNATGGGGIGLECDKFNPLAIKLQFDSWFGETIKRAGPELTAKVLKIFHVDSWECGSQNWSPVFREAFRLRRGYDPIPYLPVMAGIPVNSAAASERFLHDVRQTIAELVNDTFYGTLVQLAHEKGCSFSAESVAPTMVSDGMLHYSKVDVPMGEFWLNSPTHDKPNDMLDAISGAHIYGKNIIQAEAFTTVRMAWNEHPAMLKTLQDRNYALGINKLVYHVFTHNPWTDRKPGMTLDGVGLYFQRDQTWWKPGYAWVDYARRCQALLQCGRPVVDIAVFTGEEIPRRAILPDRLVTTLPGIFGNERIQQEAIRLANVGEPLRSKPDGVTHSANMADPEDWTDPLRGYAYDSFNEDALLRLANVRNGRVELPGGASYAALVLPLPGAMTPAGTKYSTAVNKKIGELTAAGLKIIGSGRPLKAPFMDTSFDQLGIARDVICKDSTGEQAKGLAWTHRTSPEFDIYFISNQYDLSRNLDVSLRVAGRVPELWDPVTGDTMTATSWEIRNGRTLLPLKLDAGASLFIIFRKATAVKKVQSGLNWLQLQTIQTITGSWQVKFDTAFGGPVAPQTFSVLKDWTTDSMPGIRYYSGTAGYTTSFEWTTAVAYGRVWLQLTTVNNMAEITVNGIACGVAWTPPYRVDITKALKPGINNLQINVSNTWANSLIGAQVLPDRKKITRTTAPFRLEGKPLQPSGLTGPVTLVKE